MTDAAVFDLHLRQPVCAAAVAGEVQVCGRVDDGETAAVWAISVNGVAGRMRIDPGGPIKPICNPDYALGARFTGGRPVGLGRVGPVEVRGGEGWISMRGARWRPTTAIRWSERRVVMGADCWMGPAAWGHGVVTFRLGPARGGERTVALLMYERWRGDGDGSTDASIPSAGGPVQVRFDGLRDPTALTAPAVLALGPALGASVDGPPVPGDIQFSVARPLRRLRTRAPLVVGPLVLDTLWARVGDYGDANGVRSVDPAEAVPDEIAVTGRAPKPGRSRIVRVGRGDLARCVAITFDFKASRIALTC